MTIRSMPRTSTRLTAHWLIAGTAVSAALAAIGPTAAAPRTPRVSARSIR